MLDSVTPSAATQNHWSVWGCKHDMRVIEVAQTQAEATSCGIPSAYLLPDVAFSGESLVSFAVLKVVVSSSSFTISWFMGQSSADLF